VTSTDTLTGDTASAPINDTAVLARADQVLDHFQSLIQNVPYEDKGVFFSEMLFVLAAVGPGFTGQVMESGRARGQSTFILGGIFPQSKIISIEFDRDSPDAPVAEDRLKDFPHVELLYGDSRRLLFERLEPGAVVIIDGPKGFRAIRLALQLLRTGKVHMVFIHDTYKGLATRRFLERHVPGTLFSDHEPFVERFKHLDKSCWDGFNAGSPLEWRPAPGRSSRKPSYGPTFACIPHDPACAYGPLLWRLHLANVMARAGRSANKKLGRRNTQRGGV
jgi:hypothetical protein